MTPTPRLPALCRLGLLLALAFLLHAVPGRADGLKVEIEGVEGALLDNVRAHLSAVRLAKDHKDVNEAQVRRAHRLAGEEIQAALAPFGYYNPGIEPSMSHQEGRWQLRYLIRPGPQVRVETVEVSLLGEGAGEPELKALADDFPLAVGAVLDQPAYEAFKSKWQTRAFALGYLDAAYASHRIAVDAKTNRARIELRLDTGPLYRFGPVTFRDGGLREELLRRYLTFSTGEPFRNRKLLQLQSVLEDSGYFDGVDVLPQRDQAQGLSIPILVDLTTRKRQRYTAGVGFGTDTGPRLSLGWEHRRINRRGHRLAAELSVSTLRQSITGRYWFPVGDPAQDRIEFSTGYLREDTDTSISRQRKLAAAWVHGRGGWRETLSLSFQQDDFEVGGENSSSTLLLPGVEWARSRGQGLSPRRGYRMSLDLSGAAAALLSDTDLLRAHAQGKWIWPLGSDGRLLTRVELGALTAGSFADVPASLRFFAGGDQSVRGYAYEALGPREGGEVVGGRQLAVGSLEYDHRLFGNWGAAVFTDVGNAFDDIDFTPKHSVGLGLRYYSPIGPIRLDVARPLGDPEADPFRIHFTLGPDL